MWENEFLDEGMAADLRREYYGTRLGRQELEGEMLGDFEGALISRASIEEHASAARPCRSCPGSWSAWTRR
jgi:phage terminase large subunit-like protein